MLTTFSDTVRAECQRHYKARRADDGPDPLQAGPGGDSPPVAPSRRVSGCRPRPLPGRGAAGGGSGEPLRQDLIKIYQLTLDLGAGGRGGGGGEEGKTESVNDNMQRERRLSTFFCL